MRWLKKIGIIFAELAVIAGLLFVLYEKKGFQDPNQLVPALKNLAEQSVDNLTEKKGFEEKVLPALEQPVSRTFNWEFKGVKYSLTQEMHQSVYGYYNSEPKTFSYSGELRPDWENEYYGMFLNRPTEDKSIASLALELQALGKKHGLSDDQIVDLVLAFVQSIKYDDAKAKNILASTGGETMQYPYETLFKQSGVCSDKSFLAIAILKELGYGTAIFAYNDDNHMAIGIKCPQNYSTYSSGYCYAETTSTGNKIGIMPTFDSVSNKTVDTSALPNLDSAQSQDAKFGQLGQVSVYQKTSGREYAGIIQTQKIAQEIESLKKKIETMFAELQAQQKTIKAGENKLKEMESDLREYEKKQNIEKYDALVEKYNNFLENHKKVVKKYNEDAALYNKTIQRYNILIKQ